MSNKRKHFISKQDLIDNKVSVVFDSNNQPIIYQEFIPTGNYSKGNKWKTERKQYIITTKHYYSNNDIKYKIVSIKIGNKPIHMQVSNVVWIYFNDTIPDNYSVDHIDDNPFNNSLDNLQMITVKENIQKRPYNGANQFMNSSNFDTPEEFYKERQRKIEMKEQLKTEKRELKAEKKQKLSEYEMKCSEKKKEIEQCKILLKQLKAEWHDLVQERNSIA